MTLAGRGYNLCDVKFDVRYHGKTEAVDGTLVLVRLENLADPILSGREELGHNKLYCEIPELRTLDNKLSTSLGWLSTPFLDIALCDLKDVEPGPPVGGGVLSYKYIPKTGDWGASDVEYVTFSPSCTRHTILKKKTGRGEFCFIRRTWEELPTLAHIVDVFADLGVVEMRGGFYSENKGGTSLAETRRLS